MLTYLIILLDDTSVPYCHYEAAAKERRLISIDDLKAGIVFAMKENLNVQFVYPDYELPSEYLALIDSVDHTDIMPQQLSEDADAIVLTDWKIPVAENTTCIIKASRKELYDNLAQLKAILCKAARVNVVLTDVETFKDSETASYLQFLETLADELVELYRQGKGVQLNLLTDRIMLDAMNNCDAGVTNITLAPDGKFYLCPAFYYECPQNCIGSLQTGYSVRNQHLLQLSHAPVCRICDAYQCRRCIWMNGRLTLDMNTPSHQQCVISHIERKASRSLLLKLEESGLRLNEERAIEEMEEFDPFNIVNRWK